VPKELPLPAAYRHPPCTKVCGRNLSCGHGCSSKCHEAPDAAGKRPTCPPCSEPCGVTCAHTSCSRKCLELCSPCAEPCVWSCKHQVRSAALLFNVFKRSATAWHPCCVPGTTCQTPVRSPCSRASVQLLSFSLVTAPSKSARKGEAGRPQSRLRCCAIAAGRLPAAVWRAV
jgi:hypothetical protein